MDLRIPRDRFGRLQHFHCIHNEAPRATPTSNFTLRGLYGVILWIGLWGAVIMGFAAHQVRSHHESAEAWRGKHLWVSGYVGQSSVMSLTECGKCGHRITQEAMTTTCSETRQ